MPIDPVYELCRGQEPGASLLAPDITGQIYTANASMCIAYPVQSSVYYIFVIHFIVQISTENETLIVWGCMFLISLTMVM